VFVPEFIPWKEVLREFRVIWYYRLAYGIGTETVLETADFVYFSSR
jgi:hypothetical protein